MQDHELYEWGDHFECICGEWAAWKSDDVEDRWEDHAEAFLFLDRESQPEFNGAFG